MSKLLRAFNFAIIASAIAAIACGSIFAQKASSGRQSVTIIPKEAERRVDVMVDGKPFTSYIYPATVQKPVLFPLRTARGTVVTRGFPLEPRAGERGDHPHHVGAWFNYGNVNGIDFWGNSYATPAGNASKMGTIRHRAISKTASGKGQGEMEAAADWVLHDGSTLLRENTRFVFRAMPDLRAIDRITTWTALDKQVVFKDTKEGAMGIRVARSLEHPSNQPEVFLDAKGQPTAVPKLDNKGVTGLYRSSEGKTGDEVWGTRARWVILTGTVENEPVTLAIFDHPKNPNYPTFWHARGYGLFAANPFGQKDFTKGKEELNLTLQPKQSVTFRHRILILSGTASPERVEEEHRRFLSEIK